MKNKTFLLIKLVITAVIAAVIAISITIGNWYLPAIVLIAAVILLLVLKRRVKDVTEDERDRKIAGRAALLAMSTYAIASAVGGTVLVALGYRDALMYAVGSTILYSASALIVLYALLFKIYARKQDQD